MNVCDGLIAVKNKPGPEQTGMSRFKNLIHWSLFYEEHGEFDYSRGFVDSKLKVAANMDHLICLDDEALRGVMTPAQWEAERIRAIEVILQENPDCQFGFLGWKDIPGVTHIFVDHYFIEDPYPGFIPVKRDLPVVPFLWPCWADYGNIATAKKTFGRCGYLERNS